jgi:hypothetical protein
VLRLAAETLDWDTPAKRLAKSVEVLLKRYAKYMDSRRERNNRLIAKAFELDDEHPDEPKVA